MSQLFERHVMLAGKVLDLRLQRQNIVTSNLANINTPEYKPRRIEFEEQLQKSMDLHYSGIVSRTDPAHMPTKFNPDTFTGDAFKEFKPRYVYGEDAVNLDEEVSIMNKNTMLYEALSMVVKESYSGIKKVIREGSQ
jgi:flagellar basal-body rod protein FlgB